LRANSIQFASEVFTTAGKFPLFARFLGLQHTTAPEWTNALAFDSTVTAVAGAAR
jgi:hypothetical protein